MLNPLCQLLDDRLTKRPTSCMLVLPKAPKGKAAPADDDDFESSYDEVRRRWIMTSC